MAGEAVAPPDPVLVPLRFIRDRYSLSKRFVYGLVAAGRVRSLKTGSARSAQRLYRLDDVLTILRQLEGEPREGGAT